MLCLLSLTPMLHVPALLALLASQFLPSVTELVVAQCYYLDFDDKNRQKPIYVYLNSTGCINDQNQVRALQAATNVNRCILALPAD